ncbi:MAG TPA: hypothetical protein H9846_03015, partial [Candidatus Gemmiger excrementipullorum]|nr:hypothetical protein [Candidatus Gemmiger excrementipullorum]
VFVTAYLLYLSERLLSSTFLRFFSAALPAFCKAAPPSPGCPKLRRAALPSRVPAGQLSYITTAKGPLSTPFLRFF